MIPSLLLIHIYYSTSLLQNSILLSLLLIDYLQYVLLLVASGTYFKVERMDETVQPVQSSADLS